MEEVKSVRSVMEGRREASYCYNMGGSRAAVLALED